MDSGISNANSLLESFETQLEKARHYLTIEPYRVNDKTYMWASFSFKEGRRHSALSKDWMRPNKPTTES